jgi:nicotinamidase-related amidase
MTDSRKTLDVDLADCAALTFEMQRGIVGDLHTMPVIFKAVQDSNLIAEIARLLGPLRAAGLPVIHLTAIRRPDRRGTYMNMPFINQHLKELKDPGILDIGSPGTEVVPELRDPDDIVLPRLHGVSGFTDTGVDSMLRSLDKRTIILTGSSVNRGIIGVAIEGVNRGYRVVIPREAVTGYPLEYRDMVLEHSLRQITTLCTVDEILALL